MSFGEAGAGHEGVKCSHALNTCVPDGASVLRQNLCNVGLS